MLGSGGEVPWQSGHESMSKLLDRYSALIIEIQMETLSKLWLLYWNDHWYFTRTLKLNCSLVETVQRRKELVYYKFPKHIQTGMPGAWKHLGLQFAPSLAGLLFLVKTKPTCIERGTHLNYTYSPYIHFFGWWKDYFHRTYLATKKSTSLFIIIILYK